MNFDRKKNELGKHFITLKDGEEVVGVCQGEPHVHYNHWDNANKRSTVCIGEDCKLCAGGDKKKFRFRLNMIVKGTAGLEPKILEGGWKLYNALGEINVEYPLEKTYIKVKRTGKTMNDTVYTVLPSKALLSDETKKMMETMELLPLDPRDPFWSVQVGNVEEESVPF